MSLIDDTDNPKLWFGFRIRHEKKMWHVDCFLANGNFTTKKFFTKKAAKYFIKEAEPLCSKPSPRPGFDFDRKPDRPGWWRYWIGTLDPLKGRWTKETYSCYEVLLPKKCQIHQGYTFPQFFAWGDRVEFGLTERQIQQLIALGPEQLQQLRERIQSTCATPESTIKT